MNQLAVMLHGLAGSLQVGRIGIRGSELLLEFSPEYLDSGLDLAPLKMPARPGLIHWPLGSDFGPLPGLVDDTMPDAWGLKVMDRHLAAQDITSPSLLQRLAWIGDAAMGALSYEPAERDESDPIPIDLARTAQAAVELISGQPDEVLDVLAKAGGSPGGARPKVVVGIGPKGQLVTGERTLPRGYTHALVKFAGPGDSPESSVVEYAYLQMASDCGIDVPAARLLTDRAGRSHLAVKRFDRDGEDRVHISSASGLLHARHDLPSLSYESLVRLTRKLTGDQRQVKQMLVRAVFNVVAHNRDDHSKNFSYRLTNAGWSVAPAYDLTFSRGPGGEHATSVAGHGKGITRAHLATLGKAADMSEQEIGAVYNRIVAVVDEWNRYAHDAGVSEVVADAVGSNLHQIQR